MAHERPEDEHRSFWSAVAPPRGYNGLQRVAHWFGIGIAMLATLALSMAVVALLFLLARWAWRAVLGVG